MGLERLGLVGVVGLGGLGRRVVAVRLAVLVGMGVLGVLGGLGRRGRGTRVRRRRGPRQDGRQQGRQGGRQGGRLEGRLEGRPDKRLDERQEGRQEGSQGASTCRTGTLGSGYGTLRRVWRKPSLSQVPRKRQGSVTSAGDCLQAEEIRDALRRHGTRYLFVGKSGAILHGFPDTTQDAVLFVQKHRENGAALVAALRDPGFETAATQCDEIVADKDFVQLRTVRSISSWCSRPTESNGSRMPATATSRWKAFPSARWTTSSQARWRPTASRIVSRFPGCGRFGTICASGAGDPEERQPGADPDGRSIVETSVLFRTLRDDSLHGLAGDDLDLPAHGPRILRKLPGPW